MSMHEGSGRNAKVVGYLEIQLTEDDSNEGEVMNGVETCEP